MNQNISAQDFLRTAAHTAHHFGFSSIEKLKQHPACRSSEETVAHRAGALDRRNDALHGMLTSGMVTYFENRLHTIEGPALFYSIEQVPRSGEPAISFQVFNVKKSIAEALLIQTIRSFLIELGFEDHAVRINSIGDSDSVSRYTRDLTNYLRKRIDEMPAPARELMKENPIVAFMHLVERKHELADKSPNPLEYLTDTSRKHFREIVEFLDMSGIPFEIDSRLVGHHECYSEALFAFDLFQDDHVPYEQDPIYIRGGRYNTFISKMSKMKVPAAGAVMMLRDKKQPATIPTPRLRFEPSIFVVQLGFGPKVKSLMLIDELKRAGIPVRQNVISDSLSEQLRQAETHRVRYAVIIGQKEYVENSAILRDLERQTQENVSFSTLPERLRKIITAV